ncbi:peroxiredoxin-like family protein [Flavobacterium soyangense]|uniref:thioredoxin-dependent peroxiredoxin n=1 Tax=Flavobacterium soyangense TaxID=2023265 RepID=A0A930UDQ4_9FLAO|nr:peroxiredoxin-like family protein [Flavobacterium soyangense]MBF2709524.1 AhpC/TSA family protein [Flavobacterium soyangense]
MNNTKQIPNYNEEKIGLQANLASMIAKESLDVFVNDANLLATEITSPLKVSVGDKTPLFELPNALGNTVSLQNYLDKGPVVITFYRGNWCPYCNLVLNAYQRILPEIKAFGANLIAISPQKPDSTLDMQEKQSLEFEVLSDDKNEVAKQFTTIIKNSIEAVDEAKKLGVDFYDFYDDQSRDIPVPAVFIIAADGTIIFAKSEGGDYSLRVEPQDILNALGHIAK